MKKYWAILVFQLAVSIYAMEEGTSDSIKRNPYKEAAFFKISSKGKNQTIICLGGVDYVQSLAEKSLFESLSGSGHQVVTYYDKGGKKVGSGEIFLDQKTQEGIKKRAQERLNGEKAIVAQACRQTTKKGPYIIFYDKENYELARMMFPNGSHFNKKSIAEAFNLDVSGIEGYTDGLPLKNSDSTEEELSSVNLHSDGLSDKSDIHGSNGAASYIKLSSG